MSETLINFFYKGMLEEREFEVRQFCRRGLMEEIKKKLAERKICEEILEMVEEEEASESTIIQENDIIIVERPSAVTIPEPPKKVTFKDEVDTQTFTKELPIKETWDQEEEIIA